MQDLTLEQIKAKLSLFKPIRIGLMGWNGPDGIDPKNYFSPARPLVMAVEEGIAAGMIPRNVEFVTANEDNLPKGTWHGTIDGYKYLIDQGCCLIVGSQSNDNDIDHLAYIDEKIDTPVPVITWNASMFGSNKWVFRLGNGECGGEISIMMDWVRKNGYKSIGVIVETVNPEHEEHYQALLYQTRKLGIKIAACEFMPHIPVNAVTQIENIKNANPDCLVFVGCGMNFTQGHITAALKELDWYPPRIATSAFMYYPVDHDAFEGWVGIDQYCPENPRYAELKRRYFNRYHEELGLTDPDADFMDGLHCLSYDTGQVIREAIFRAPMLTPEGLRQGLERIRWVPAVTGGPGTHIGCMNYEHNLFNGDYLVLGKMVNGKLQYEGLYNATDFDVKPLA